MTTINAERDKLNIMKVQRTLNIASGKGIDGIEEAFRKFKEMFPGYSRTSRVDELRSKDYIRLDTSGHVYLDYTGASLYSEKQLMEHMDLLRHGVYGNPHSNSPASAASTELADRARKYILQYFNASPDEYAVIFTHNTSAALKIIGESYPFSPVSRYVLTYDNHNSVNGIREFARSKGAHVTYIRNAAPELRIDSDHIRKELSRLNPDGRNLFAFPAQSNFSGVQHSLEWIAYAQSLGWDVVLDAAAFVPTNQLDLSKYHPDFVPLSFYKMIGYPTGAGCLIVRRRVLKDLRPPWFAGGTIEIASVQGNQHFLIDGEGGFESGTINYLTLPAIEGGLRYLQSIGIQLIHDRISYLTSWLLQELSGLHHANGVPAVEIYGPLDLVNRGATIALNFYDIDGCVFNFHKVEEKASHLNISLRSGCFCNPGAGELAFRLTNDDMKDCFANGQRATFEECILTKKGKNVGAVRVSLGLMSNFQDAYHFIKFARSFVNKRADNIDRDIFH